MERILCKYGEIALKGTNKHFFEEVLKRNIKYRARHFGKFSVSSAQSTIMVEPLDDQCDIDGCFDSILHVFGLVGVSRCVVCDKSMDALRDTMQEYLAGKLDGYKTFKVEAKRSDKAFPLNSMQIMAEAGGYVLEQFPHIRVDVKNPEIVVHVEVRDYGICLHAGKAEGAGGMPVGTNGKCLLLLSGGIDSPVAGYMLSKRGVTVDAVHFESFPYTSELAKEKVIQLARELTPYTGTIRLHVVSLTHIQELLVKNCEEDYFTLILRRYMMRIADKIAKANDCGALVTGESLGQVASQTLDAIGVTNPMTTLPVFRPLIGMDKEEIVRIARKIGTFETSIQPYEDCCTVFTPRHPQTHPKLPLVEEQQNRLDFDALVEEAVNTATMETIKLEF